MGYAQGMARLFFAVPLPDDVRAAVAAAVAPARALGGDVGWTRPDTWHVTLRFVGDVVDAAIPALSAAVGPALAGLSPVEIVVGGGGGFPNVQKPRVLWVGVAGALAPVAAALDTVVAARLGLPAEDRAWKAHLTVGRVRRGDAGREAHLLAGLGELGRCVCAEVVLYRSELAREGPRHTVMGRWALGA